MRDFRNFYKSHSERTILESIMVPELVDTIKDWFDNNSDAILIGGVALSYWAKPRETGDIDVLFKSDAHIPKNINKFKHHRKHAFFHKKTHVEVEVFTPDFLDIYPELYDKVLETSVVLNDIRIASPTGIVAMKIARGTPDDIGDMYRLIQAGHDINLSGWPVDYKKLLSAEQSLKMSLRG